MIYTEIISTHFDKVKGKTIHWYGNVIVNKSDNHKDHRRF
jgi:hypothetical protein